jgi:hypothetical protein
VGHPWEVYHDTGLTRASEIWTNDTLITGRADSSQILNEISRIPRLSWQHSQFQGGMHTLVSSKRYQTQLHPFSRTPRQAQGTGLVAVAPVFAWKPVCWQTGQSASAQCVRPRWWSGVDAAGPGWALVLPGDSSLQAGSMQREVGCGRPREWSGV